MNKIEEVNQYLNQIIEIIQSDLNEEITDLDRSILEKWMEESDENKQLYARIKEGKAIPDRLKFRREIAMEQDWDKIQPRLRTEKPQINTVISIMRCAATVLIIVGAAFLFFISDFSTTDNQYVEKYCVEEVQRNSDQIILTLGNGNKVVLGENQGQDILTEDGMCVKDSLGELSFVAVKKKAVHQAKYNTITIPRGGEYKITLEEGTIVYLNAESELKFPQYFAGDVREIELKGEAYLKVSRDEARPFIVHMGDAQVEVLGTEFNIRSYVDEKYSFVTLVEGSVKVKNERQEVIINPGQQTSIDSEKNMTTRDIDEHIATAWVRGEMIFENERLEDILQTVSRWYDVQFNYVDDRIKAYHFTGKLDRYQDVMDFLAIIEKMNVVTFAIDEGDIEVRERERL